MRDYESRIAHVSKCENAQMKTACWSIDQLLTKKLFYATCYTGLIDAVLTKPGG